VRQLLRWVTGLLPRAIRRRIARLIVSPRVGTVDFGDLRRNAPISRTWGTDRGSLIDRIYIEEFLESRRSDIRGRILEFGDDSYARGFTGSSDVRVDVLDIDPGNLKATVVGRLDAPDSLPDSAFDCIICVQTLQFVPNLPLAFAALHSMLKPGGALLVTAPGIAQVVQRATNPWDDYWRLTAASVEWLARSAFGANALVQAATYGNVLSATAFLQGVAAEELTAAELQERDPAYPLLVTLVARRSR